MSRTHTLLHFVLPFSLVACAGAAPKVVQSPPTNVQAQPTIIAPRAEGTPRELLQRGERALLTQKWQEALDAFEALLAAIDVDKDRSADPTIDIALVLYDAGLAHEGLGARDKARERFREVVRRFPESPRVRSALARQADMDAFLEDWEALGKTGDAILARKDAEDVDRMRGLGARGLSRIMAGDETGATRDVQDALDLVESTHYGATNRLPVEVAQIKFALAEIRRHRSEKISFVPLTPDFLVKIEVRCRLLLDAQSAYADAIRSVDPHWAAVSGVRVGEMYRVLHRDLMAIPPTEQAKTEQQKQLFYGIMHVRYRVLLEKGIEMMRRVIALGDQTTDAQIWIKRAEAQKKEMDLALEDEKAAIAKMPFTEEELQKTLDIMKKSYEKKAAADNAKADKK